MIRFLVALGAVVLLLYLSMWAMIRMNWIVALPTWHILIILYVAFLATATYAYLLNFSDGDPKRFTQFYLGSIVLKILAACTFVAVMALTDRKNLFANVVLFLVVYLLFTSVEVGMLLRKTARRN